MDRERSTIEKYTQEDGDKRLEESNWRDNKWRRIVHLRGCRGGNREWSRTNHAGDNQHQPNKPARSQAETKNTPQANMKQHAGNNTTHNNRRALQQKIRTTESECCDAAANGRAKQRPHPTSSTQHYHTSFD